MAATVGAPRVDEYADSANCYGNETGRMIAIRQGEAVNAPALTAIIRAIIANNRAGGWWKLKKAATR